MSIVLDNTSEPFDPKRHPGIAHFYIDLRLYATEGERQRAIASGIVANNFTKGPYGCPAIARIQQDDGTVLIYDDAAWARRHVDNPEDKLRLDGSGVPTAKNAYPDDNPKTIYGVKKPPVHAIPPSAILHLGMAMRSGEIKYGLMNWRDKNVTFSTYYDAAFRHLLEAWDGSTVDAESKLDPLCHVMACCAIILDAKLQGTLNDDRGTSGKIGDLIEHYKQLLETEVKIEAAK